MTKQERILALCRALLTLPSLSGQEQQVAERAAEAMRALHYDEVELDEYGSVLGRIHGRRPGKTILLDGHIDTVPCNDRSAWKHDPYGAEVADERIYGRGSSDMKASFAVLLLAAADFADACGRDFAGCLCVSGTVHEECFEGVAARNITALCRPDCVLVGEASGGTLKIGQRGRAEIVLETAGKSCHSSNPEKGINAVYHMVRLIEALRRLPAPVHPVLGKGILELTDIRSEPYPGASVVPERCRVTFDRRLLVGEDRQSVLAPIRAVLDELKRELPQLEARVSFAEGEARCWTGKRIRAERFFPAWLLDEDHWLVRAAQNGLRRAGQTPRLSHYDFCTNASHFCGEAGIPTIGYGPSFETLCHVTDEYVALEQLVQAYRGVQGILEALTDVGGPC